MNDSICASICAGTFFKKTKKNMETKANEPINTVEYNNNYISTGLTKREYFALKTMHALTIAEGGASFITVIDAVKLADALIEELNKTNHNA